MYAAFACTSVTSADPDASRTDSNSRASLLYPRTNMNKASRVARRNVVSQNAGTLWLHASAARMFSCSGARWSNHADDTNPACCGLTAPCQFLQRILADRLEHAVARRHAALLHLYQRLIHQVPE